mgnify:CR=1 FL=1
MAKLLYATIGIRVKNENELRMVDAHELLKAMRQAAFVSGCANAGLTVLTEDVTTVDLHVHISDDNQNCDGCYALASDENQP